MGTGGSWLRLSPGLRPGLPSRVDHESCVGAAAVRSLPLAAFWRGERGSAATENPQWKQGDQHGLPTLDLPVEVFGLAIP